MALNVVQRVRNILSARRTRAQMPYIQNAASFAAERPKEKTVSKKQFFEHVVRNGQRSVIDINKELAALTMGPGQLTFDEYVKYRFDEVNELSLEDKKNFISETVHWKLVSRISNPIYDAITQDKFITYQLLKSFDIPVPNTHAVISSGPRLFPGLKQLRTATDLRDCIVGLGHSVFIKPNLGIGSVAALICDGADGDDILSRPDGRKPANEIMAKFYGRDFLVQDLIANHPSLEPITTALSTVRLTNFLVNGQVHTPLAVMKLTSENNIADNFWRDGNMLAAVEMDSGKISRVIRGHGLETELLTAAPKSGHPMIGFTVPHWQEIRRLNERCALSLAAIPFNSLDIAVTENGPVVIEVNTGGSFELPQLANRRGILTTEVRALFGL